jgi:hypothetical protein
VINHYHVNQWAKNTNLLFPEDSNCVGCFWKQVQQLRKNWNDENEKMQWFANQENKIYLPISYWMDASYQ